MVLLANAPQHRDTVLTFLTSTLGVNLTWLFDQRFAPGVVRPFHTVLLPFVIIPTVGVVFLLVARRAVVIRAVPQPKHRIRRLFAWLDRTFMRSTTGTPRASCSRPPTAAFPRGTRSPGEKAAGNLGGQLSHSSPGAARIAHPVLFRHLGGGVQPPGGLRQSGDGGTLFMADRAVDRDRAGVGIDRGREARASLDVLLTTPLSLSELLGAKLRGLRRMEAILALPIVFQTLLIAYLRLAVARPHHWMEHRQILPNAGEAVYYLFLIGLNLVILFGLAAQLAFLFGLYARTQGRAVTAVLGVFVAACFLPVVVRFFFYDDWARNFLYLSPIADILTSEFPRLGVEWGRYSVDPLGHPDPDWTFHPLLHCAFYAVIVGVLVAVNRRLAAGVLLRPKREPASSRLVRRRPLLADPTAAM